MAEGILKALAVREGPAGLEVRSAGTWGLEGEAAAPLAVEVCAERGVDLSGHVARRLTPEMVEAFDLILGMEMEHVQGVLDLVPEALVKVGLLGRYGSRGNGLEEEIPDPYGCAKRAYVRCYERIERAVRGLHRDLVRGGGGVLYPG